MTKAGERLITAAKQARQDVLRNALLYDVADTVIAGLDDGLKAEEIAGNVQVHVSVFLSKRSAIT